MSILKLKLQKYHLKHSTQQKQAALISLLKPVTSRNTGPLQKQLNLLIERQYDSYIFVIEKAILFTAHALKLLLAFQNTLNSPAGLLITPGLQKLATCARLEKVFITAEKTGTVIMKIETARKTAAPGG